MNVTIITVFCNDHFWTIILSTSPSLQRESGCRVFNKVSDYRFCNGNPSTASRHGSREQSMLRSPGREPWNEKLGTTVFKTKKCGEKTRSNHFLKGQVDNVQNYNISSQSRLLNGRKCHQKQEHITAAPPVSSQEEAQSTSWTQEENSQGIGSPGPVKKTDREGTPEPVKKSMANRRQHLRKASGTRRREWRGLRQT